MNLVSEERKGGDALLLVVAEYSATQLGTEKHPSLLLQKREAKPPGHG